ncbi:MAG: RNA polymerase factor sigma-54 [Burkholderiaceae bacterium]
MQSRQSLELRQHQQLKLTPQLQQSIRFLQCSALELETEIADAILENPLLEREKEYRTDDADAVGDDPVVDIDRWPRWVASGRGYDANDESSQPEIGQADTLQQYLLLQLHSTRAPLRDRALVTLLIDELDLDGYLPTPLQEIQASLPTELSVDMDELHVALRLLQSFDPVGVGALSLADCLLLQLKQWGAADRGLACGTDVIKCACDIAEHHLDLLASGNLIRLRQALSCSMDMLRSAHGLLLRLEPRPGRAWAVTTADYVNPDVLAQKVKNHWQMRLNPAVVPKLRVNPLYERWLSDVGEHGDLRNHVQQARGLIRSVGQRFGTVLRVAQAIARRQQAFFEHGMRAMRPLLLRDIAQELELHESTVSRATSGKFAQTPWGVLELKRFFGMALITGDGATTSAMAVRSLIAGLVASESPCKPLSDSQIVVCLAQQGVAIARRTVAKYREAEGIESISLRKARAKLR